MKKVAVIGSMSTGSDSLNGQTVKTKVLIKELCLEFGDEKLYLINTSGKLRKVLVFSQIIYALFCCSNIIILPAENGLKTIVPYLSFFNTLFKRSLHYDVIGGWLPKFLESRPYLICKLKGFSGIYVETNNMKKALEIQGLNNVFVVPNCKDLIVADEHKVKVQCLERIYFATFSRVMKAKGIEDAVIAVHQANIYRGVNIFHLDVYGFIEPNETSWFEALQNEYQLEMTYKGLIPFNKSTDVLQQYYGLLFPTYYSGEGFAGTLIDAFAAGLPVIASDWKYNREIVQDGKDGIIVPVHAIDKITNALLWSQEHFIEWNQFKSNVIMKAKCYLPSVALKGLKDNLR